MKRHGDPIKGTNEAKLFRTMQSNILEEEGSSSSHRHNTNNPNESNKLNEENYVYACTKIYKAVNKRIASNMNLQINRDGNEYLIHADMILNNQGSSVNFRIANLAEMFFDAGLPKCSTRNAMLVHFIDPADPSHSIPDSVWEKDGELIKKLCEDSRSSLGSGFERVVNIGGKTIRRDISILYSSALSSVTKDSLTNGQENHVYTVKKAYEEIFLSVLSEIHRVVLDFPSPIELFMPSVLMDVEMNDGIKKDTQVDSCIGMLSTLHELQVRRSDVYELIRIKNFRICSVGQAETKNYLSTMKKHLRNSCWLHKSVNHLNSVDGANPIAVTTSESKIESPSMVSEMVDGANPIAVTTSESKRRPLSKLTIVLSPLSYENFDVDGRAELVPVVFREEPAASSSAVLTESDQPSSTSMDYTVPAEMIGITISSLLNSPQQQERRDGNLQR